MRNVIALLPHGLAALSAVVLAVAGFAGGWLVAAAAGLCVLGLAVGWGDLLRLPHKPGTAVLVGALGAAALVIGTLASTTQDRLPQPLSVFAAVIAIAVLTAFAHELVRQDGRRNLVESLTGTVTGQVIAVLASGWVLLAYTRPGSSALVVTAAAVAGGRLASGLPLPLPFGAMAWVGVVVGVLAAFGASFFVSGVPPLNAAVVGLTVSGVAVAIDQLFGPAPDQLQDLSMLARAAAPVAAAGTVAFAVIRIGIG
jgi:hypothetical protein